MTNRLARIASSILLIGLIGCEANPPAEQPILLSDAPYAEAIDEQAASNYGKLLIAPLPVRQAYLNDFPESAVTSVQQRTAADGRLFFDITFLRNNGEAGQARYFADGQMLPPIEPPGRTPPIITPAPIQPITPSPQPADPYSPGSTPGQ